MYKLSSNLKYDQILLLKLITVRRLLASHDLIIFTRISTHKQFGRNCQVFQTFVCFHIASVATPGCLIACC